MSVKYLAAYALASLAKPTPNADDVAAIFKAVNLDVEKDTLDFLMESIDGRDAATLVAEGVAKRSMSSAVASAGAASGPAAADAKPGAAPAAAAAKEEKPVEEEDDEMGFGLFD